MRQQKSFKKQKYEEQILQELSTFLRRGLADSRLQFVSFTKVEMSADFSYATIYWDSFDPGHKGDIADALTSAVGRIRSHLAKSLDVRQVPQISFVYDAQYEEEQRMERLLKSEQDQGRKF